MKYIKNILWLCFFLPLCFNANAQTKTIEALKKNIAAAKNPKGRLQAYFLLCDQGYSLHPDTLMAYAHMAFNEAMQLKDRDAEVRAMYHKSAALTNKALLDSALHVAGRCQEILQKEVNDPLLLANVLNKKAGAMCARTNTKKPSAWGIK